MPNSQSPEATIPLEKKIENLEASIDKLISYCEDLSDENDSVKHSNNQLMLERSELQTKNDKVRGQVEAMVERLKAMDKAS
ncbi:MAG: TIGR02449 family protein [Cocleimonas sp.]